MSGEQRFTLTANHLTLLRAAYVRWEDCEFGAPAIDCKRPYGNSDVVNDMCDLLGVERDDDEDVDDNTAERMVTLHRETLTALAILVRNAAVEPGEYVADPYRQNWRRSEATS